MSQPPEPTDGYGYGAMPPPPDAFATGPAPTVAPPQQVVRAAQCLYGLAALQIIGVLISLFSTDAARDTIRENDSTLTDSEINTVVMIGLIFSIVLTLAFAGLWFLCARKMLAGKTWARIVATILTGLIIVLDSLTLAGGALVGASSGLSTILTVVGLILSIAFVVFAWSKPSNGFFASAQPRY